VKKLKFESLRYSGNKDKILPRIESIIEGLPIEKAFDGFSGSTKVSQFFKYKNFTTISNDLAIYSKISAECYLKAYKPKSYYREILEHLDNLIPEYGWYSENYGGFANTQSSIQKDGLKKPFQMHVTKKLDVVREEIDKLYPKECVDKSVLLTSLLLGLDKVCNDMGHQVSYLKDWSGRSYNPLVLKTPNYITDKLQHKIYNDDIFNLNIESDLHYFDPPYGTSNQKTKTTRVRYASYYHLWTTICKNDKPELIGASKRRYDVSSDSLPGAISLFENTKDEIVEKAFVDLFKKYNKNYILLSYSNRSKLEIDKLIEIVSAHYSLKKILQFKHSPNSQTFAIKSGDWKNIIKDENHEFLILAKGK
jgi:adenine-specific DNA-methyltransferase